MKYRSVLSRVPAVCTTASLSVPHPCTFRVKTSAKSEICPSPCNATEVLGLEQNKRSGTVPRSPRAAVGRREAGAAEGNRTPCGAGGAAGSGTRERHQVEVDIKSEIPILSREVWLKEGVKHCN